jgi:hypothetical protein
MENPFQRLAYKFELPPESKLHLVFHVSLLRKRIGNQEEISPPLPESPATSAPRSIPRAILGTRKKGGEKEALVYWQNLSPAEPAWESLAELKTRFFLNLWELRLQACQAASFFEEIIVNKI